MTSVGNYPVAAEADAYLPYRPLSKAAVISTVLGVISIVALLAPVFAVLPLLGAVIGIVGWTRIRRYPTELSGRGLALVGTTVCLLLLFGSVGLHTYIYVTERPDGYERLFFSQLKPERGSREVIPPDAAQWDGRRIFIKGYVHPGVASQGAIQEFILVPDMGTCCFGGQPELTDMITVTLREPLRTRYNQRIRKLGGVLRVNQELKRVAGGLTGGIYELEADYLDGFYASEQGESEGQQAAQVPAPAAAAVPAAAPSAAAAPLGAGSPSSAEVVPARDSGSAPVTP